jgi:hypothetical protein
MFQPLVRIMQPGQEMGQADGVGSLRVNRTISQPEVEKEVVA